jgi:cytochrome c oxidase assembly factor CtaG
MALVVALVSPLHPWGRALFAAHMTQHEILMLIAAPLLVLGRPMIAFLKALPPGVAGMPINARATTASSESRRPRRASSPCR